MAMASSLNALFPIMLKMDRGLWHFFFEIEQTNRKLEIQKVQLAKRK
jgi:hypothetical protein